MKLILATAAIGASLIAVQPAHAETIYLDCTLAGESGKDLVHLDVTLNEDAGNAGFVIRETGWSPQKMTAAFTPREVSFVSPSTLKYSTTVYRVDRTNLAFSEEHKVGEKSFWRRGTCALAPKVERKF